MCLDAVNSTSAIKALISVTRLAKMGGLKSVQGPEWREALSLFCTWFLYLITGGGSLTPSAGQMLKLFSLARVNICTWHTSRLFHVCICGEGYQLFHLLCFETSKRLYPLSLCPFLSEWVAVEDYISHLRLSLEFLCWFISLINISWIGSIFI